MTLMNCILKRFIVAGYFFTLYSFRWPIPIFLPLLWCITYLFRHTICSTSSVDVANPIFCVLNKMALCKFVFLLVFFTTMIVASVTMDHVTSSEQIGTFPYIFTRITFFLINIPSHSWACVCKDKPLLMVIEHCVSYHKGTSSSLPNALWLCQFRLLKVPCFTHAELVMSPARYPCNQFVCILLNPD